MTNTKQDWLDTILEAYKRYLLQDGEEIELAYPQNVAKQAIAKQIEKEVVEALSLSPEAEIALMVSKQQLKRGENPPINTTSVLVFELDRLAQLKDISTKLGGK